jgi:hypothetical protein
MTWQKFLATFLDISESEIMGIVSDNVSGAETVKRLINDRHEKKLQLLATALSGEDDLGKVVRAHIHIEHELQELIIFAAPSPAQLKKFENMEFSEKLHLALVLGLKAELKPALTAIGTLRNRFAHKLDMKIGEEIANNLIATFAPPARQRLQALVQGTLSALPRMQKLGAEELPRIKVQAFFIELFDEVGEERQRLALEKMRRSSEMNIYADGEAAAKSQGKTYE